MNYLLFALAVLFGMVVSTPVFAQAGCKGSCSQSKGLCIQRSGNASRCDGLFRECMATGQWIVYARGTRGTQVFNRCKR